MTNEALVLSIQNGEDRYSELWEQTRRFISMRARRYHATLKDPRVDVEDLEQAGFFALRSAVKNYTEDRDASFLHYLSFYLRPAFQRTTRTGKADALDRAESLDTPVGEEDFTLSDSVSDPAAEKQIEDAEERIYTSQLRNELEQALDTIPKEQATVVRMVYFGDMTERAVSKKTGAPLHVVHRNRRAGIGSLRRSQNAARLRAFVELNTHYYWNAVHVVENIAIHRENLAGIYRTLQRRGEI